MHVWRGRAPFGPRRSPGTPSNDAELSPDALHRSLAQAQPRSAQPPPPEPAEPACGPFPGSKADHGCGLTAGTHAGILDRALLPRPAVALLEAGLLLLVR